MYGHIKTLAEAEKRGVEAAGGTVDLYQYVYGRTYQEGQ
jgi:NAD(P)H dehydrogenase (quinone)